MRRYGPLIAIVAFLSAWLITSPARGSAPPRTSPANPVAPATLRFAPAGAVLGVGEVVTLTVEVAGAQDLGGFQFDLTDYDPSVVQIENMGLGTFLGSTGRMTGLLGPQIDNANRKAVMGGYSYAQAKSGASGDGPLAWVRLRKVGAGSSSLTLDQTMLVNTQAQLQVSAGSSVKIVPRVGQVHLPLILRNAQR